MRQAISVVKKRSGDTSRPSATSRMDESGLHVGPPLKHFRGILSGIPIVDDK